MPLFKNGMQNWDKTLNTKKKRKEKSTMTEYWHGIKDNFTSAMYTRHIFLSEGASSFSSED